MDRLSWTELDVKAARREWAVTTFALADPVVLPFHLRELSDAERREHAASDEEGSRVLLRVDVGTVVKVAAVVVLVVVGVRVVRSLMP